jgi:hypothetical protein
VTGWWFSPGIPVSSTNNTDLHHIAEILLKVALNTIWLGLIFTLLGFILFIVGYSTQSWYYEVDPEFGDEFYYGIWRTCSIVADTMVEMSRTFS